MTKYFLLFLLILITGCSKDTPVEPRVYIYPDIGIDLVVPRGEGWICESFDCLKATICIDGWQIQDGTYEAGRSQTITDACKETEYASVTYNNMPMFNTSTFTISVTDIEEFIDGHSITTYPDTTLNIVVEYDCWPACLPVIEITLRP